MNKIIAPAAIAVLAFSVTGCDFFRALAGRPTSEQLSKNETQYVEVPAADTCSCCTASCCASDTCDATATHCSQDTCCVEPRNTESCCAESCCAEPCAPDTCCAAAAVGTTAVAADTTAVADNTVAEVCDCCAPEQEPQAEQLILGSLGQRTGFLKVDVNYSNPALSNTVKSGYYILIGTFKEKSNADRLEKSAKKAGLDVTRFEFVNGKVGIAIMRSDDLGDAFVALGKVRKYSFAPKDACIIVAE